jgi:hypothetical protein
MQVPNLTGHCGDLAQKNGSAILRGVLGDLARRLRLYLLLLQWDKMILFRKSETRFSREHTSRSDRHFRINKSSLIRDPRPTTNYSYYTLAAVGHLERVEWAHRSSAKTPFSSR